MLKQRVLTAIVLLIILLPALFYPDPGPFCAVMGVALAAAAWEWGRLQGLSSRAAVGTAVVQLFFYVFTWASGLVDRPLPWLWTTVALAWIAIIVLLLRAGVAGWLRIPFGWRCTMGIIVLWVTWLAMAQARVLGVNFLMSVLVLVWTADIGAYFAGRTLGLKFTRSKLAPSISPGKSWEGVWGGLISVLIVGGVWVWADAAAQTAVPSLYSRLAAGAWWMLLIGTAFLVAMSVCGDLIESLVKRAAGVKDSSQLLPGHGGVLDRVDALLPTVPAAMMLVSMIISGSAA